MGVNGLEGTVPAEESSARGPVADKAAEGLHLAGSAIVTGGVAALLAVIAIPISIGIGVAGGVRSIARRSRGERN
jgi:hypothetical protein